MARTGSYARATLAVWLCAALAVGGCSVAAASSTEQAQVFAPPHGRGAPRDLFSTTRSAGGGRARGREEQIAGARALLMSLSLALGRRVRSPLALTLTR